MASKANAPVSIRIRLKYPDAETFIEKYAANISKGGMFIQSRAPQSAGTLLRFQVLLQDGATLLEGEGHVIWVKEYDTAHPSRVHGMGVRFSTLTPDSELLVERVMAFKSSEGFSPQSSRTQQVRNLLLDAAPPAAGEVEELSAHSSAPLMPEPPAAVESEPDPPAGWERLASAVLAPEPLDNGGYCPPLEEQITGEELADLHGGSGVTQLLAASERQLVALMQESHLSEHQLLANLAGLVVMAPSAAEIAAMERLLEPVAPVPINPDDAASILRSRLREYSPHRPVTASKRQRSAMTADEEEESSFSPSEVTPLVSSPPHTSDLDTDPGELAQVEQDGRGYGETQEAALLSDEAADSPAEGQLSEQAFDQSDDSLLGEEDRLAEADLDTDLNDAAEAEAEPTRFDPQAPADEGWSKIQTSTEVFDHRSAVLEQMASYASAVSPSEQLDSDTLEQGPADRTQEQLAAFPPLPAGQDEEIPSLEDLAQLSPAPPEEEGPPEAESPFEIKPRKSGLFDRIFGKKD